MREGYGSQVLHIKFTPQLILLIIFIFQSETGTVVNFFPYGTGFNPALCESFSILLRYPPLPHQNIFLHGYEEKTREKIHFYKNIILL